MDANLSPCKGKSFKYRAINKAFALTGRLADCYYTQGDALGWELLGLQPVLKPHAKVLLFIYKSIVLSSESGVQTRWRDADNGDSR